jgi:3-oxoacyl-[acyl-carrier protein] reductase
MGLAFARAGARVAFTYSTHHEDADETRRLIPEALVFQGSVTDAAHAEATVAALGSAWGGLDVLVNNAGTTKILPIALLEEADWDHVMDVNVKGAYLFSRAALKPMIRARQGHILNIGSFATDRILAAPVHYAAAKAALRGFSEALAKEVGRYGVRVNYLAPGLLDVGLSRRLPEHRVKEYVDHSALRSVIPAERVAAFAAWLVSDANSFMTGARVVVDGGL